MSSQMDFDNAQIYTMKSLTLNLGVGLDNPSSYNQQDHLGSNDGISASNIVDKRGVILKDETTGNLAASDFFGNMREVDIGRQS